MQKSYPPSFAKAVMTLFVTLTLLASCTKGYDPGNLLNDRITLLTGQPGSVNWILTSISVNNFVDPNAAGTRKVYRQDGTFTDDLGFTGYWTMSSRDSLIESTRSSVNPDAPYFTNRFHIDYLDKGQLQLTYNNTDKRVRLIYDSNK